MGKTNWDMAHNFFYNESGEDDYPSYKSCGYRGNRFFSYRTVIAMIVENKNGKKVTLVSDNSVSNTTAKHIANVRSASPHKIYYVPFEYGAKPQTIEDVARRFSAALEDATELKFTLKANRETFCDLFEEAKKFSEDIYSLDFLESYSGLYSALNDPDDVKAIKEKARKANSERIKELRKELKDILEKPYLDIIKIGFSNAIYLAYNFDLRQKVRKVLDPKSELSFVWKDDHGNYRTSKGVKLEKAVGDYALKLWKDGRIKHGQKVGIYTVLSVTNEFVRIGCHTIPTKNLEALYECL